MTSTQTPTVLNVLKAIDRDGFDTHIDDLAAALNGRRLQILMKAIGPDATAPARIPTPNGGHVLYFYSSLTHAKKSASESFGVPVRAQVFMIGDEIFGFESDNGCRLLLDTFNDLLDENITMCINPRLDTQLDLSRASFLRLMDALLKQHNGK